MKKEKVESIPTKNRKNKKKLKVYQQKTGKIRKS